MKSDTYSNGPSTDAGGHPVIDPTANVIALVAAAEHRLDDLRAEVTSHTRELMTVRAEYDDKLRAAESDRIDAIRAVDVGAVNRAAEVSAAQALTLATQVATSAETLRNQVAAAAEAQRVSLAAALVPIQESISDLRRVQYEQQGAKTGGIEQHSNSVDFRTIMIGVLGVLATAALIVSPHVH